MSIGSNITAIAVNTLLSYLLGNKKRDSRRPSPGEARKAATVLADASYKFLHAGLNGDFVKELWPDGDEARCTKCGCTDSQACEGGCSWVTVDREAGTGVCSSCDTPAKAKARSKRA